jgi:hypothetical protein
MPAETFLKDFMHLSIVSAGKARTTGVIMDGFSRDPETETTQSCADSDNRKVQGSECDLLR